MTTDQDLYLVLGVDPSTSASQIRRAYRTLMRRHHPDTRMPARQAAQTNPDHEHDTALRRSSPPTPCRATPASESTTTPAVPNAPGTISLSVRARIPSQPAGPPGRVPELDHRS
ncbi:MULTISPECIES: J domain-containing protein [Pseudofrankia]|uniref:J domain-containing protein n=1 Tax=Pseudofrankia TaxID=2994363 RepID=UPI001E3A0E22|nr:MULTISPECIES: DnaJ domain-containing protein [Pseudofrankia]